MPIKPPTHKPASYKPPEQRKREYDQRRGKTSERGYGYKWQKARSAYLKENPLCVHCQVRGEINPANEVDHVRPHRGDQVLFWDVDNWQPLCKHCHSRKTWRENRDISDYLPDSIPKSRIPLYIVAGPPGSGKTTYCQQQARDTDLIIDLDEITSRLSGLPWYQSGEAWLRPAIEERNRILSKLSEDTQHTAAWFIVMAPKREHRQHWADMLGAERVLMLAVEPGVCVERIKADDRRQGHTHRLEQAVYQWWSDYLPWHRDEVLKP